MLIYIVVILIVVCLTRAFYDETGCAVFFSSRQATMPARYDERTLAPNHSAAAGKRVCHKTIVVAVEVVPYVVVV